MRFWFKTAWGVFLIGAVIAPVAVQGGLSFDGVGQYVTFGTATNLGSPVFTVETWFNWSGGGMAVTTGNGGVMAIPLIAKLCAEQDGDNRDGNYFLGIRTPEGVLAADLEEGATGVKPGLNHPVSGVRVVTTNTWHHAAVTYNGTNWLLFLDGNLEATLAVGQPPRSDSIQHAALASSLNSIGAPQGYFAGILDEVRIWNYARSASEIASNRYVQIRSAPGLFGRWSCDETSGLIAHDSSGHETDGTLVKGPSWTREVRAVAEVVTPFRLSAIDPERTAALRQTENKNVPPVFRFDPGVAEQVEKSFRTSFLMTREKFLAALAVAFPHRTPNSQAATNGRFAPLVASFQSTNKGVPLGINLAGLWADGHVGSRIQTDLAARLREVMTRYICPDSLPSEASVGPANVHLYSPGLNQATPDLDTVQAHSLNCPRTNVYPLGKARNDLRQRFPAGEEALANYLAGFLKENCRFDAELTRQIRTRHAESFFAADHYEPGQVLVHKGQIIDARIKAALEEWRTQTTAAESKARAATEQAKAENALREMRERTALSEFKSQHFGQQNRWLFGGLMLVVVSSSIAVWQLARSRRVQGFLPVPVVRRDEAGLLSAPLEAPSGGLERAERALRAAGDADRTSAALRAGLLWHLAQWLKEKLVRELLAERSHLLSTHEQAELELAELEARLAKLHAPMEQRLKLYRQRIDELERELAARGEENRELIQAKIELTRKRLEAEQDRTSGGSSAEFGRP